MDVEFDLRDMSADKRLELYRYIAKTYKNRSMLAEEMAFMNNYHAVRKYDTVYVFPNQEKYVEFCLTWL